MSEPYDVTRPGDADRGLRRFCDRTGREWTEPDPSVVWWQGRTRCGLCGWEGRSVIPISREHSGPVVPMECPDCGGMTISRVY